MPNPERRCVPVEADETMLMHGIAVIAVGFKDVCISDTALGAAFTAMCLAAPPPDADAVERVARAIGSVPCNGWFGYGERGDKWLSETKHEVALLEARAAIASLSAPDAIEEAVKADAERYRWLRRRLQMRHEEYMDGKRYETLSVRIGHGRLDRPRIAGEGYLSQERFERECQEVDAKIDAAIRSQERATEGER